MNRIFIKKLISKNPNLFLEFEADLRNEILALFGKSGAGKTTILRCLAGLTNPDEGIIEVNGDVWFSSYKKINLSPQKRDVGFVFQDLALFPNMSVRENLEFASRDVSDNNWIDYILELVEMQDFAKRKPTSLSGGQKQRVAFGRAIARKPKILLMDEPFSALDFEAREKLRDELLICQKEFQIPIIWVSHDKSEIEKLAQRIAFIEEGKILKLVSLNS